MKRNRSTTLPSSQEQASSQMGFDLGFHKQQQHLVHGGGQQLIASSLLRHIFTFFAGCAASFLLLFVQSIWDDISRSSAAATGECQISFGKYRGKEYTTETGGTVGRPICLVESKFLKVQQHSVRMPPNDHETGSVIPDWLWIDYHDRINVLVEAEQQSGDQEPHFLVFEQTKYALEGRMSLAIVGGIIEPHEEPEQAARREVEEEMGGLQCQDFHFLGRFRTDVNRGMGWTNTFLAANCRKAEPRAAADQHQKQEEEVGVADTERQDLKRIGLNDLRQAAIAGKFLEIQWTAAVTLALLRPEFIVESQL
jgi:8-oxo-dGTP pyrophosphatase MutT (NUDIX family)